MRREAKGGVPMSAPTRTTNVPPITVAPDVPAFAVVFGEGRHVGGHRYRGHVGRPGRCGHRHTSFRLPPHDTPSRRDGEGEGRGAALPSRTVSTGAGPAGLGEVKRTAG